MSAVLNPPLSPAHDPIEQRLVLYSVDWEEYQRIADAFTGRHVRLTYSQGVLEFMTISPTHARLSALIAQIVAVLAKAAGLTRRSFADMTLRREDVKRAIEPDACFYLANEPLIRSKDELDFAVDPPPDLGIEIDISATSRRRMPIYAALRIPEVWRYSGDRLTFHRLADDGTYVVTDRSLSFPFVSSPDLNDVLARRNTTDEESLLESFRAWATQQAAAWRSGQ